ncbi:caspase family protein [Sandarakinorhabdus rubra]|uniref:caspase family protein n=1 Tax=Sandarakinorhabdus rubra TaxID=2672568 RepID=UPI0013DB7C77|nr:caspase family protein [Sandarakinorhabdus rubra]
MGVRVLQIGIDAYLPEVRALNGCRHDVARVREWLDSRFAPSDLAVETLLDADATRPAVIAAIRNHLGRAGPGDAVLLHYAGHGARSTTNAAFFSLDADLKDEGLVCHDSRQERGFDLADKEMALLIEELAATGASISLLMDCCHSGSITRDADDIAGLVPRMTTPGPYKRDLETYLEGQYVRMQAQGSISVPRPRHLSMAACSPFQTAKESAEGGVFTSALLDVLQATGGELSHAELFQRVRVAVRGHAQAQDPQFEAIGGFDAWSGFLGRTARGQRRLYHVLPGESWQVECGAIHGLASDPDRPARLLLYASGSDTPAGGAEVLQVGAQTSLIRPDFAADPDTAWRAGISSLPLPPLPVADALPPARSAELAACLAADTSIGIGLAPADAAARYRLAEEAGAIVIRQTERDLLLTGVASDDAGWAPLLAEQLKSIATWERLAALANPRPALAPGLVDFAFTAADGTEIASGARATLDVAADELVRGRIRARNRSAQPLHLALVYFSSEFGIHVLENAEAPPGGDWVELWGNGTDDYLYVESGAVQADFLFKLLVSTERVDDFLLAQQPLDIGSIRRSARGLGTVKPAQKPVSNDWFAHDLRFRLVRRQGVLGPAAVALASGQIRIAAHPAITAQVALASARPMTRDLAGSDFWKGLAGGGAELVNFAGERGDDASVLELSDIAGAETLAQQPLDISIHVPVGAGEMIVPLAFDGQHVLPVGRAWREADGSTRLLVDHLPDLPDDRRSLGKALKLYMFKTVLKQANVNSLRRVVIGSDGAIDYDDADLIAHVARAQRILLLVHGIIGDTRSLAEGVAHAGLASQFDLVLAYDYENLSTPIADTAAALKDQLAAKGITGDKRISILAHSMGGLVSRALIELNGGAGLVDHLVMCGTPNAGSPFGRIDAARNLATLLLGLAGNAMPPLLGWAVPLASALNATRALTPTLEQMNPASDFLRALNAAPRPATRYTILAGDIAACAAAGDPLPAQLVVKLGQSALVETLFGARRHDIAVSVDSIDAVVGAGTAPPLACHHLNYFASPAGLAALRAVAWA